MPRASLVEGIHTAHVEMDSTTKRKRPAFDRFTGPEDKDPTVVTFLEEISELPIGKALFEYEEPYLRQLGLNIKVLNELSKTLARGKMPDITLKDGSKIDSLASIREWYYHSVSDYHPRKPK